MEAQTFRIVHIQQLEPRPILQSTHIKGQQIWGNKLLTFQQNCKATLRARFNNGFFSAFLYAYNNHGDVKITPDQVWIVIMLFFSKYVNDRSQQLRNAFVSHEGKKELVITTENELQQTQWDQFFTLMIEAIEKNTTKGVTEKFQCNFSTSRRFEKLISTAVIMNTYKNYFSYERQIPDCGIRNVHFGGTLEDWKKVLEKTQILKEYDVDGGLKKYVGKVSQILNKFIDTYQGNVDVTFWNKIMNEQLGELGSSTTTYISGWLINFFFAFQDSVQQVDIQNIDFDIKIDNRITGVIKTVKMVGGFKAVSNEGHVYRPHLSFAIQDPSLIQSMSFKKGQIIKNQRNYLSRK